MLEKEQTLYGFFEIPQNATLEEIKTAYKKKAIECHQRGIDEACLKEMCKINKAYIILTEQELNVLDEIMQAEFINWIIDFSYHYQYQAFEYYRKLETTNDHLLNAVYESFEDIINYEKNISKKDEKSLHL